MVKSGLIAALALALSAAPATASQPYSQSMAQCAGLYGAMNTYIKTPERRARIETLQEAWMQAAIARADAEGIDTPEAYAADHARAMQAKWEGRGLRILASEEFRDWAAYCRAFGKDRGIRGSG